MRWWARLALAASLAGVPALAGTATTSDAAAALDKGLRLAERSEKAAAIPHLRRAAELARSLGDAAQEAAARRELGLALDFAGHPVEAREQAERALFLARGAADARGVALAEFALGRIAMLQDWGLAHKHYLKALAAFDALGDERGQARALGRLIFGKQAPEHEREWAERGLALARRTADAETEALILESVANGKALAGNLKQALEGLQQAMALVEGNPHSERTGNILWSIGRLHRLHGSLDKSLAYYRQALKVAERQHDRRRIASVLNSIGAALDDSERPAEAIAYHQRAADLARAMSAPQIELVARTNVAEIQMRNGQHARAARVLQAVLAQPGLEHYLRALYEIDLARAELGLGRADEALRRVETVLRESEVREYLQVKVEGLLVRARVHAALLKREAALADLQEGLDFVEARRSQLVDSDALREAFSYGQELSALSVDLLSATGREVEALETAERARARAFLDLLAARQNESSEPAEAAPAHEGRPASFASMAATARRLDSSVISYFVTDDTTVAWVVSPRGELRSARLPIGRRALSDLVARARPARAIGLSADAAHRRVWRRLYDTLLGPLRPWLPAAPAARLTIVPHGPLILLPFAALRSPAGRYLVEDYAIHYAPALGFFGYAREPVPPGRAARSLIVADPQPMPEDMSGFPLEPLPGSRQEARAVAGLLGGDATILSGREATEDSFRGQAGSASIVHLATHGLASDERPEESFLAFARRDGDDGRLTAKEVYGLKLSADLVVLSGCGTAVGRLSSDGVLGLTRAFLSAGTPSVVSSTWDVGDDQTIDLMRDFYQALSAGSPRDQALRGAQLRMLARLRAGAVKLPGPLGPAVIPEDPLLWAGFVLIGEP